MGDPPELDPNAFKRPSAPLPARGDYQWSRKAAGPMSFGLRGRIALTVGTLLVPVFVALWAGIMGILLIFIWVVFITPLVLRDVWKRERVLRPDRMTETSNPVDGFRHPRDC